MVIYKGAPYLPRIFDPCGQASPPNWRRVGWPDAKGRVARCSSSKVVASMAPLLISSINLEAPRTIRNLKTFQVAQKRTPRCLIGRTQQNRTNTHVEEERGKKG